MTEFNISDQAFYEFVRKIVQTQISQNQEIAKSFPLVQLRTGSEIWGVFGDCGLTPKTEEFSSQFSQDSMKLDDPFMPSKSQSSFLEELAETEDDERYDEFDEAFGEEDEPEFETLQEAREYAERVSRELFDEIMDELAIELTGRPRALDLDPSVEEEICRELVFPDVWEEMDV